MENLHQGAQERAVLTLRVKSQWEIFRLSRWQSLASLVVIVLYLAGCAALYRQVMRETNHLQPYLLDDTYIQAAMGRNLAFYHTYGVSPGVFSTASSSIFWPFLLAAAYKVLGLHLLLPLLLNVLLGIVLIVLAAIAIRWLAPGISSLFLACILFAVVAAAPLWTLTFIAMEHIFFAASSLLLFAAGAAYLGATHHESLVDARPRPDEKSLVPWLCAAAFFSCGARFEGAFLVFVLCMAILARKRIVVACLTAASGALPVLAFSAISLHNGAMYMPNSLVMKAGRQSELASYGFMNPAYGILGRYSLSQGLGQLFIAAVVFLLFFLLLQRSVPKSNLYGLVLFICTCLIHSKLARMGWLYRYESYLVVIGIVVIAASIFHLVASDARDLKFLRASCVAVGLVAGCSLTPLMTRAQDAFLAVLPAARNVYTQQYQMAQFVHRYHDRDAIVINDVGAITYFTHGKVIDLAGLASNEVARLIVEHRLNPDTVQQLASELTRQSPSCSNQPFSRRRAAG